MHAVRARCTQCVVAGVLYIRVPGRACVLGLVGLFLKLKLEKAHPQNRAHMYFNEALTECASMYILFPSLFNYRSHFSKSQKCSTLIKYIYKKY